MPTNNTTQNKEELETYKLGEFIFTKNSLGYFTTPEITGWFYNTKREIEFSEEQLIKMGAKQQIDKQEPEEECEPYFLWDDISLKDFEHHAGHKLSIYIDNTAHLHCDCGDTWSDQTRSMSFLLMMVKYLTQELSQAHQSGIEEVVDKIKTIATVVENTAFEYETDYTKGQEDLMDMIFKSLKENKQ